MKDAFVVWGEAGLPGAFDKGIPIHTGRRGLLRCICIVRQEIDVCAHSNEGNCKLRAESNKTITSVNGTPSSSTNVSNCVVTTSCRSKDSVSAFSSSQKHLVIL